MSRFVRITWPGSMETSHYVRAGEGAKRTLCGLDAPARRDEYAFFDQSGPEVCAACARKEITTP